MARRYSLLDPLSLSGIPDLAELSKDGPRETQAQITQEHLNAPRSSPTSEVYSNVSREAIETGLLRGSVVVLRGVDKSECAARGGYVDLFSGSGA